MKIYVDRSGKVLCRFSPKEWAAYLNEFIEERSYLLIRKKITEEEEIKWMYKEIKRMKRGEKVKIIAIEGNEIAGVCDVYKKTPIESQGHNVYFGIGIRKKYRGKNIGKKLLKKAIEIAKKELKAKNMWIEYVDGNEIAKKLYEKMGFVEEARLENYVNHFGKFRDKVIMRLKL